jgi:triacylglycerol esterase/lipase EstA (alpha/beta hydrolase family)
MYQQSDRWLNLFRGKAMLVVRLAAILLSFIFLCSVLEAAPIVRLTTHRAVECEAPCNRAAVVFIHGITGSQETWGDPNGTLYWPKMLAAESSLSNDLDIYQLDYDSNMFEGPAAIPIEEGIEAHLDRLLLEKQYSKVIFIAHSLGGIFARTYLLHVKLTYGHAALSRFRLVITLGTPNEGADLANFARLISMNEQLRILRPVDVNDFQQLVNKSLGEIQAKHEACASMRSFAAFEKLPVTGAGIIVSERSATKDAFFKIGFDRNHIELSKPASFSPIDPVYDWATRLIQACVRDSVDVCPTFRREESPNCPAGDFRPRNPN